MVDSGFGITVTEVVAAAAVVELSVDTSGIVDEAAGDTVEADRAAEDTGVAAGPGAVSAEARSVNDLVGP